jgi:hypothetical protein
LKFSTSEEKVTITNSFYQFTGMTLNPDLSIYKRAIRERGVEEGNTTPRR